MKSLIVIIALIGGSWYYTDLDSESTFASMVAPIGVVFGFICFTLWLVVVAGVKRRITVRERFNVN